MSKHLRLVAVGDGNSGKTELLHRYAGLYPSNKHINEFIMRKRFQDCVREMIVDSMKHTVIFMDTECDDDYKILRGEKYEKADCFLLCYSIKDRDTFCNVYKKWILEMRHRAPFAPVILVGTDAEARNANNKSSTISRRQAENVKLMIGAYALVECSLAKYENVDNVFIEAIRAACSQ